MKFGDPPISEHPYCDQGCDQVVVSIRNPEITGFDQGCYQGCDQGYDQGCESIPSIDTLNRNLNSGFRFFREFETLGSFFWL